MLVTHWYAVLLVSCQCFSRFTLLVVQGCRVPAVERLLLSQSVPKPVILLLNKVDLVPLDITRQVHAACV